jgi:hypothetical protein
MNSAEQFRKNAVECRDHSNKTRDPKEKAQWLKLSEHWEVMAAAAHARPDGFDAK